MLHNDRMYTVPALATADFAPRCERRLASTASGLRGRRTVSRPGIAEYLVVSIVVGFMTSMKQHLLGSRLYNPLYRISLYKMYNGRYTTYTADTHRDGSPVYVYSRYSIQRVYSIQPIQYTTLYTPPLDMRPLADLPMAGEMRANSPRPSWSCGA